MRTVKIRDIINTQKRNAVIAVSSGIAICMASILTGIVYTGMFPVAMIGFAVAMGGITFMEFGLSCPKCQGRIGNTANYPGNPFSVSRKICFCPFCGVALDSHLDH